MNRNQIRQKQHLIRPQKILVVDDDPIIRDMMVDILECEGHTPELARNGQEAFRILSGPTPTSYLVFLDLLMPKFSGKDLCTTLAAHPNLRQRHIIVLMSALDNIPETLHLDVDMVMPKPFIVDDVEEALALYLG